MSKSERGPKRPRLENGRKMSLVQAGIWDSGVSEGRAQMELELRLKHRVALDTVRIKAHLRTCIVCKEDRLCEYKCVFCATSLCSGCQIQLAAPAKYRAGIDDLNVVKTPPPPPKCPNCSEKLTLMHEPVTRQLDNGEFARAACKHKCGFFVVGPMYLDKSGKRSSSEAEQALREDLTHHEVLCPKALVTVCPGITQSEMLAHVEQCKTNPTCNRFWKAIETARQLMTDVGMMEAEEVARDDEISRLEIMVRDLRRKLSEARGDTPGCVSPTDFLESSGYSPTYSPDSSTQSESAPELESINT